MSAPIWVQNGMQISSADGIGRKRVNVSASQVGDSWLVFTKARIFSLFPFFFKDFNINKPHIKIWPRHNKKLSSEFQAK